MSRTLAKKQMMMSVATKVAIQLNCKLGGEVWTLEIPVRTDKTGQFMWLEHFLMMIFHCKDYFAILLVIELTSWQLMFKVCILISL